MSPPPALSVALPFAVAVAVCTSYSGHLLRCCSSVAGVRAGVVGAGLVRRGVLGSGIACGSS